MARRFHIFRTNGYNPICSPLEFGSAVQRYWNVSNRLSLFTTDSGSTNITSNGQTCGRIEDLTGNGHHFTQSTPGNRPTYRPTLYTTPALKFDENNDLMLDLSATLVTGQEIFVIANSTRSAFPGPSNNSDPNLTSGVGGGGTIENSLYNAFVTTANAVSVCQQHTANHWLDGAPYTEFDSITPNVVHVSSGTVGSPSSNTGLYLGGYSDSAHLTLDAIKCVIVFNAGFVDDTIRGLVHAWAMAPGRFGF